LPFPLLLLLLLFHYSLIQIWKQQGNDLASNFLQTYTYTPEWNWDRSREISFFLPCSVKVLGSFLFLSASNLFWTCSQKVTSEHK
jgi:hypothetical protein